MSDARWLTGTPVSPGVAIGPACIVEWELPAVPARTVSVGEVPQEIERLREAVAKVRTLLDELRERTKQRAGPEEAKIFDAQMMMVGDEEFLGDVEALIRENQLSAERAFEFKALEVRAHWTQSASARLRQRVADLWGIQLRVLNHLVGQPVDTVLQGTDGRPAVVFTRELTPGLSVQFEKEHVAGFASEEGTRIGHAAILARSQGIPCVMGLVGALERIEPGMEVILDGTLGTVILDPTPEEIEAVRERERAREALARELEETLREPAVTVDGTALTLRGNLDLPEELGEAVRQGAEGIGLLRTEFLMVGRTELPDEDEQTQFFERVVRRFPDAPVVVRSYDLGGDKFPLPFRPAPEANPFLGWRAIRVCLDEPDIFQTQIRAMLRARRLGDLQLMLPLVTQLEELDRTRDLVGEAARELEREGIPAASELPVGVMIETPAAVMLADHLAERSDFLSVGTNDLTQYTLAVDRGNARLAERFTALHPAVLRMLAQVRAAARAHGLEPSVCGEMASHPLAAFALVGLGYRVLSVAPLALPLVRWFVRQMVVAEAVEAAEQVLAVRTAREATALLEEAVGRFVEPGLVDLGRLPGGRADATLNTQT